MTHWLMHFLNTQSALQIPANPHAFYVFGVILAFTFSQIAIEPVPISGGFDDANT